MSYGYRGDYYRGDYYRGDPGFLSGVGKALKGLVGGAVGYITGGVSGAVRGAKEGFRTGAGVPAPAIAPPSFALQQAGVLNVGPSGTPQTGVINVQTGTAMMNVPGVGLVPCAMKGQRLNKSGYYKQVQRGNPANVVYVPPKSACVRTRRLNVANPKALRRAIRRAQGFAKLARRVMTFVSAKAPKGRAKFKKRR